MQMTFATLYRFLHMHVDKLIKGNKCIHVPLHVCRSFAWQLVVSVAQSGVCVVNVEMVQQQEKDFQWDPTDACLNEGGKGQGAGGGIMLLLHLRVGDCFRFWIGIRDEIEAVHRCLSMRRVNLEENASETFSLWIENRCRFSAVRREKLLSLLRCYCSIWAMWAGFSWSALQGYLSVQ